MGLLPIRRQPVTPAEKNRRDQLLSAPGMGMGAAQLHEELGGQLADVSAVDGTVDVADMLDVSSVEAERCSFFQFARS